MESRVAVSMSAIPHWENRRGLLSPLWTVLISSMTITSNQDINRVVSFDAWHWILRGSTDARMRAHRRRPEISLLVSTTMTRLPRPLNDPMRSRDASWSCQSFWTAATTGSRNITSRINSEAHGTHGDRCRGQTRPSQSNCAATCRCCCPQVATVCARLILETPAVAILPSGKTPLHR